ncbi:MAG TPA: indole-3-glycerol phosphate synthase TrpC [Clostridia bacterium]|nr:indole-3-glycerol phosphate synthase TrpC [Clostridia bacterium]
MILDEIIQRKELRLKNNEYILEKTEFSSSSFYNQLKKEGLSIIGELKKASPSKGIIDNSFDYLSILELYNESVDGVSVLTEEDYFLGSKEYLVQVKSKTNLPVLRKDFIINKKQILESHYLGADAILLIVSILTDEALKSFYDYAISLNLDVIVEVHDAFEVESALKLNPKIIGINNRNLKNFSIDLGTTRRLKKMIPDNILVISESGIKSKEDIKAIGNVNGVLIGESFMRSKEKKLLAKELKLAYENEN